MSSAFALSPLDESRFGIRSARGEVHSLQDLDDMEARCGTDRVVFLVVRAPTAALGVVQEMERRGYFLADTLLFFERDLRTGELPQTRGVIVTRQVRAKEAERVREIAGLAFEGYFGHYHADPHFESSVCDDIYADWAYRGCLDRSVADHAMVAEHDGEIIGFGLIKIGSDQVADGTLYGVHPHARGRGTYRELVVSAMRWARERGCARMIESTQVTNLASQKVWTRLGFEPSSSFYTLHRWFETEPEI